MSGWKSRWSWLRLVNTEAVQWIPSARRSSSACEEISIAHATSPASSISRNVRWRSIASGVVRSTARPRRRRSTSPCRAARSASPPPRASRASATPSSSCRSSPYPDHAQLGGRVAVEARRRRCAIAARMSSTWTSGTPSPSGRQTTSAAAPRATASGAKSWPSRVKPGTQKNSVPGSTLRLSKARPVISTSSGRRRAGRAASSRAECMGAPGRTAAARSGPRGARAAPAPRAANGSGSTSSGGSGTP